jgi:hypothetical protein
MVLSLKRWMNLLKKSGNPRRFQRFCNTVKKHITLLSVKDIDMITELFCWLIVAEVRETGSFWLPNLGLLQEKENGSLRFTATKTCREVVRNKRKSCFLIKREKPSKTKLFHEWRHIFIGIKRCLGLSMGKTYALAKIFSYSIIMDLQYNYSCTVGGLGVFKYDPKGARTKFSFKQKSLISLRAKRILRLAKYDIEEKI